MANKDVVCLRKMLRETQLIRKKRNEIDRDTFLADEFLQHGFVMALVVIGELAKLISPEMQSKYPHIPWVKIRGLRNAAAHAYGELRMEDIWETIELSIPELECDIIEILHNI